MDAYTRREIHYVYVVLFLSVAGRARSEMHEGLYIGKINTYAHQVSGQVYAIDEYTILIKNFFYDGLGQDTFFWAGSSVRPSNVGFIVPDEEGKTNKLQPYTDKDIYLHLPDRRKITSVRWLAIWNLREHAKPTARKSTAPRPAELTAERLAGEALRRSWYRGILLALETVAFRQTHAPRRSASAVSGESRALPASGPRRQLPDAATPPSRSTRTTLSADGAVGTDLSAAPSHLRPKSRSGGAESQLPPMPRAPAQAIRPFGPALPAVSPDSLVHSLENKVTLSFLLLTKLATSCFVA
ncbi:hypothetical protein ISCGN_014786 [Ixodes scapularis]